MNHTDTSNLDGLKFARFHVRNTLAIFLVLTGFMIGCLILMAVHHTKSESQANETLKRHFLERVVYLDSLLKQVTNHLTAMKTVAEADLKETQLDPDFKMPALHRFIQDSANDYFHLDQSEAPFEKPMIGNLTGLGSSQKRDADFYREIRMALNLTPLLRSSRQSIKTAAWTYYISSKAFIYLYPWVASREWKFSRESFNKAFYTQALPENNPKGAIFWTPVYIDEVGMGLMSTCAAPIYDTDRFVGVAALDLTVDFLNAIVSQFRPEQGVMFLANQTGQLVAHPQLTASKDKQIKHLSDAVSSKKLLTNLESQSPGPGKTHLMEKNLVISADLKNAPWKVVYLEKSPPFLNAFIQNIGLDVILVICGLLGMATAILAYTQSKFITPAEKLVKFILARNRWQEASLDESIPRMWRPWFNIVDETFRTNEDLTNQTKRYSETLERRVKQRTMELVELADQLLAEIDERERVEEELRDSEEKFRTIVENSTNLFYSHTEEHEIIYISPQSREFLQCEPEEAMIQWTEFATDNPINQFGFELTEKAIQTGQRQRPYELELMGKAGKVITVEVREAPILKDGRTVAMVGSLTDITDRKVAEREKAQLQSQLVQSQKMESIGTLSGGVAHEFNNILGIILGNAELAMDDAPHWSPVHPFLLEIRKASLRGKDVVKQLLSFSRKNPQEKQPLNLVDLVKESIRFLRASIPKTIAFETSLCNTCPPIMANQTQIHQLLINICYNAAHAMEDSGGVLTIRLEKVAVKKPMISYDQRLEPGDYIQIAVSDDGHGVPDDVLAHVFDPFFTTKPVDKGSGMGLSVVYGIMKDHDGFISIENNREGGATVRCFFPPSTTAPVNKAADDETMPSGDETILFVDDEISIVNIGRQRLERLGYTVDAQTDPVEALSCFQANPERYDLLITDMTMPRMAGDQFLQEVKTINPLVKTIICTGYSQKMDDVKAAEIGACGYLMKPIDRQELARTVRQVLDDIPSTAGAQNDAT